MTKSIYMAQIGAVFSKAAPITTKKPAFRAVLTNGSNWSQFELRCLELEPFCNSSRFSSNQL
jgi:hypothetical protein